MDGNCIVQRVLQEFVDSGDHSRFWAKVAIQEEDECGPWIACSSNYGRFGIWKNGKTYGYTASRVALALHTGIAPKSSVVSRHSCDNTICVNFHHLLWGSQLQNIHDSLDRDRFQRGSRHYKAKLTEHLVRNLRRRVVAGEKQNALAVEFGLSKNTISKVILRKTWRHI